MELRTAVDSRGDQACATVECRTVLSCTLINRRQEVPGWNQALVKDELGFTQPLPEGDLSEHLDSIQRLSFVVAIEDHYHIAFEPEDDEKG